MTLRVVLLAVVLCSSLGSFLCLGQPVSSAEESYAGNAQMSTPNVQDNITEIELQQEVSQDNQNIRSIATKNSLRLYKYKHNASARKKSFTLTDEQAIALFTSPCHYCGYSALPECCNGIDRVDNSGPYSPDNSVSCCSICNRAKGAKHVDEFMGILKYYRISYASYNGSCKFQTHTGNDINNNNESPIDSKDT
eukprot:Nk52_evm2s215 gene=Nk52_evmTU2s215